MKEIESKFAKLREEIEKHRTAYYVQDNPTISDEIYDALFKTPHNTAFLNIFSEYSLDFNENTEGWL